MRPSPVTHSAAPRRRLCQPARARATISKPRDEPRAGERREPPAEAAGRTRSGHVAQVAPGHRRREIGETGQHAVEKRDVGRLAPFCGP